MQLKSVAKQVSTLASQYAIIGDDSVDATAPWIAAIGDFRNSVEGLEKFVVTYSGVILSSNMVLSAASRI